MPKTVAACKQCGQQFEFYPSQNRLFCSTSCRGTWHGQHRTAPMPVKPKTGRYQPCERCGTEFWVIKSNDGRRRFCSKTCHDAAQTKTPVVKTCAWCSKEFSLKPSQAEYRGSERVYCSRACEARARIRRPLDRERNGKPAVIDTHGYVRVYEPAHPAATKAGWVFEHRLVVEERIGRFLRRDEHVHHINHIRDDNRSENLAVLSHAEHSTVTAKENREALQAALTTRQKLAEYERRFGPLNI